LGVVITLRFLIASFTLCRLSRIHALHWNKCRQITQSSNVFWERRLQTTRVKQENFCERSIPLELNREGLRLSSRWAIITEFVQLNDFHCQSSQRQFKSMTTNALHPQPQQSWRLVPGRKRSRPLESTDCRKSVNKLLHTKDPCLSAGRLHDSSNDDIQQVK
jgi:hypothetical protein